MIKGPWRVGIHGWLYVPVIWWYSYSKDSLLAQPVFRGMSRAPFWTLHHVLFLIVFAMWCFEGVFLGELRQGLQYRPAGDNEKMMCLSMGKLPSRELTYPLPFGTFLRWCSFLPRWDMLVRWMVYQRHDVDVILTLNVAGWLGLKSQCRNYSKWDEGSYWQIWHYIAKMYIPRLFCDLRILMSC